MKRLVLIFVGDDTASAKALGSSLRNGDTNVQLGLAAEFNPKETDVCNRVIVMPDVHARHRERISLAYGGLVETAEPVVKADEALVIPAGVSVQHRGFGKWYLMNGNIVVSGPHSKDEAERLAA